MDLNFTEEIINQEFNLRFETSPIDDACSKYVSNILYKFSSRGYFEGIEEYMEDHFDTLSTEENFEVVQIHLSYRIILLILNKNNKYIHIGHKEYLKSKIEHQIKYSLILLNILGKNYDKNHIWYEIYNNLNIIINICYTKFIRYFLFKLVHDSDLEILISECDILKSEFLEEYYLNELMDIRYAGKSNKNLDFILLRIKEINKELYNGVVKIFQAD